jgi:hypothetical protein
MSIGGVGSWRTRLLSYVSLIVLMNQMHPAPYLKEGATAINYLFRDKLR